MTASDIRAIDVHGHYGGILIIAIHGRLSLSAQIIHKLVVDGAEKIALGVPNGQITTPQKFEVAGVQEIEGAILIAGEGHAIAVESVQIRF